MNSYLVVGTHPWNKRAFLSGLRRLAGRWRYTDNPKTLLQTAKRLQPRYIFFLHWSHKVPAALFQNFECVCFHMTDVPYGRGGTPLQNLILRGHRRTTLTALQMTASFDAGPVYLKRPLSLTGRAEEIYERGTALSIRMIRTIARSLPRPRVQKGRVVIFKRRKPEESQIPESLSPQRLYDFIRMLDAPGYPHAFLVNPPFRYSFSNVRFEKHHISASVTITKHERKPV